MTKAKNRNSRSQRQAPQAKPEETTAQKPDSKGAGNSEPGQPEQEALAKEIRDLRREEYDRHISLFQFYCDIALKANLYFYLITGGITSFYFNTLSQSANSGQGTGPSPLRFIEVSFLLPIFLSGVLGGVFFYGRRLWLEVVESIDEIRDDLSAHGLSIKKTPEVSLLASLLLIFGSLFFLVGCALTVLMAVQMKNRNEWSKNHSWDELLRTPKSYLILLPTVVILFAGMILPKFAHSINWVIKRLRQRKRRRLIRKWSAKLRKAKLDDPGYRFKDTFLYYRLRPHLGEETIRIIKTGTFSTSLIMEDLEELKVKWELAAPAPPADDRK